MGWLIAACIVCGLLCLPLGFRGIYRASDPGVWLLIGPLKFRVYPSNKKEKASGKKTKDAGEKSEKGGNYRDFQPVIPTIIDFMGQFRRKIQVNHLELKWTLVDDDPADLAVNYGRAWAALGGIMPQIERLFVIKKRDVQVLCDFTGDKSHIFARLDATITLGRTLDLLSRHGLKVIKELLELKKLRKGGAKL